jgi:hypothetical protein
MNKTAYGDYLKSERWKTLRNERLEKDHHRCVLCGSKNNLRVHHINYEHLENEDEIEWLVTVCDKCHHKWHKEILPDIISAIAQLQNFYERKLKEVALEYAQERDAVIINGIKQMSNQGKYADKCRVARIASYPGYKGASVKISFQTPYDSVIKAIGGKGKKDNLKECYISWQ